MALRNIVEGDCGGQTPLMKVTGHFSQDQAFRQERAAVVPSHLSPSELMVNEFLEETYSPNLQTFQMNALMDEMRSMEISGSKMAISQAPNVAQLAPQETQSLWTEEFLRNEGANLTVNQIMPQLNVESRPEFDKMWHEIWSGSKTNNESSENWVGEFAGNRMVQPELDSLLGYGVDHQEEEEKEAETTEREDINSMDFWRNMQKVWESMINDESVGSPNWETEFLGLPKEYEFETENPMKDVTDPFEEGLKKLEEGDLPSAVLCFEAAAQKDPENPLVWQYLGTSQAENEHDPQAIPALKKCLTLQPDNLVALMALSISYANESFQNQACHMLKQWIEKNPLYSDLAKSSQPSQFDYLSSVLSPSVHTEVRDLFIAAANKNPHGKIDADIQCGLGVLFNLSNEHDKAVDCFKAALQVNPNDFRMWNRLGATLANGNRSEEAVDAYYNALRLSPGFIRARYNLGITCINLSAYREAIEHLLMALNQQAKGEGSTGEKGAMSDSIWSTLRLATSLFGSNDMDTLNAVENRNLELLNREFEISQQLPQGN